ncbi:hypothetical protein CIRG_01180 [Coccidioides immitis RMSCC 2394]|uniref:Uncharacterized protein n=1 Tax=Coccidioides immitis RMSCC 2394 TaxID=404692 RepID=A0A0J6Y074_COCIT|nr:hypothetical protein CIRG_01180 [Coccidioides immitis RMSCC 2394]
MYLSIGGRRCCERPGLAEKVSNRSRSRSEKHANFQPADRRVTDTTIIIIDLIVQDKKQAASCSLTLTAAPHPSYLPCPRPRPRLPGGARGPSSSGSPHPSAQSPSSSADGPMTARRPFFEFRNRGGKRDLESLICEF